MSIDKLGPKPDEITTAESTNISVLPEAPADAADIWQPRTFVEKDMDREPVSKRVKVGLWMTGGLVALGLATGGGIAIGNAQKPAPVAEAPADPTPEVPLPTNSPEQPSEPISPESFTFAGQLVEQTIPIEVMNNMDVTDIAKLPFADRFANMIMKTPSTTSIAPDSLETESTIKDTPSEIPQYYWTQALLVAYSMSDPQEGAKYLSGLNYYTQTDDGAIAPGYELFVNDVLANGGKGVGIGSSYIFEGAGTYQSGTDRYGNQIDWMNVTVTPESDSGIKGETTTIQAVRVPVKLLTGETYYPYSMGYTTSGTASPVDGKEY